MLCFRARLLEYCPRGRDHDRVCGYEERRVAFRGVVERERVYVESFSLGGTERVFEGGEGFGKRLGERAGEDFEGREAELAGVSIGRYRAIFLTEG